MNGSCRAHAIHAPETMTITAIAGTVRASHLARGRNHAATTETPNAARIGIANPNVMKRSGGNHRVTSETATPATVASVHATSARRANPLGRLHPIATSGSESHSTYRVHRWMK